jgi:prephenate dehydrogenase
MEQLGDFVALHPLVSDTEGARMSREESVIVTPSKRDDQSSHEARIYALHRESNRISRSET